VTGRTQATADVGGFFLVRLDEYASAA